MAKPKTPTVECEGPDVGQNVHARLEDDGRKLILEVDLTQDFGLSNSGKTHIIAKTNGPWKVPIAGKDMRVGLNVYRKP